MATHELAIALPPGYRAQDVIAFHSRDAEGVAEQVSSTGLRKGVLLDGVPVLLDVALDAEAARCSIDADTGADVANDVFADMKMPVKLDIVNYDTETKPDMARTEALLERYKPHRTMAAAYLWASLNDSGGD